MEKRTFTHTQWYEATSAREAEWSTLTPDAGCAMDFIASSALLEWLVDQRVLSVDAPDGGRFSRYRDFSRLASWEVVVPQLVLFDEVLLSIGTFYSESINLAPLADLGFFKQFPRPVHERFYNMYELLRPVVCSTIAKQLHAIAQKPYEQIWTHHGHDARAELRSYEGLAEWLFREYSKDVCGLPPNEGELIERLQPGLAYQFFDFVEYACSGQGHFLDAPIPYVSSILKPQKAIETLPDKMVSHREDSFALYQMAISDALGFQPVVKTIDDVLRLREDKHLMRIRELLGLYRGAANRNEAVLLTELSQEVVKARNAMKRFQFTDTHVYTYGVTTLGFVPGIGSVVSILSGAIQLLKDLSKRKHGWIYFGVR